MRICIPACTYVCMYVLGGYACACTYVPVHAWLYANMRTAYVYTLVRGHIDARVRIYLPTSLPSYLPTHASLHVYNRKKCQVTP